MLLQARKIDLLPGTEPSSLLFEPSSASLAVMLSDSSFLLYPSFSPFSPPPSPTPVPPISSAACFLRLKPYPNPDPGRILFLSAYPGSSTILLRAWILLRSTGLFAPARLGFKQDPDAIALPLPLPHGVSVRLAASVNVVVVYSVAADQIWVMAVRLAGGEDGGRESVRFSKCAVIDCTLPIYSVGLSGGFLMLGEVGGVRVFPLRPLVKGKAAKNRRLGRKGVSSAANWSLGSSVDLCKKSARNGVVIDVNCGKCGVPSAASSEELIRSMTRCGIVDGVVDKRIPNGNTDADRTSCKPRTIKLTQTSGVHSSFFIKLRSAELQSSENHTEAFALLKALSVHALSLKKFLILDSAGGVNFLNLHSTSESTAHSHTSGDARVNQLSCTMKVQLLAVLLGSQDFWISDGGFSVHVMPVADLEATMIENEKSDNRQKEIQISAIQAIFTSNKVHDIVPLSVNAILVLGQGNIFAYGIA